MIEQISSLKKIIGTFNTEGNKAELNAEIDFYRSLDLKEAIDNAVFGRYVKEDGLQYFNAHYKYFLSYKEDYKSWNIEKLLYRVRTNLLDDIENIKQCSTFDHLYSILEKHVSKIKGLAVLFCYDAALRIGNSREFQPNYLMPVNVYIQHGAKEGAKALFKNEPQILTCRYIIKSNFAQFEDCFDKMEPYLIECFLCVKKNDLKNLR